MFCVVRSKQHSPHHHHSSKLGSSSSPGENYVDYMILETPQSPMNMQTASMDPYMYHQVDKTSSICVKRQGSGIRYSKLYVITYVVKLASCLSFQHRYQDEAQQLLTGMGGAYARPSSRAQANQRERERDRQLLQEALSLYLASAQPSYRHRGAAAMTPAGEHLQKKK